MKPARVLTLLAVIVVAGWPVAAADAVTPAPVDLRVDPLHAYDYIHTDSASTSRHVSVRGVTHESIDVEFTFDRSGLHARITVTPAHPARCQVTGPIIPAFSGWSHGQHSSTRRCCSPPPALPPDQPAP